MNDFNTALLEFLHWLDQQEWITSHIKAEFLNHLQANGVDQKSLQYMQHVLAQGESFHNKEAIVMQKKLNLLRKASSLEPGLVQYQVGHAQATMTSLVDDFNDGFKTFETQENKAEEAVETQSDAAQIAALKASL